MIRKVIFLFLLCGLCDLCGENFTHELMLGYQFSTGVTENKITRNRPYLFASTQIEPSNYSINIAARFWGDTVDGKGGVELREFMIDWLFDHSSVQIGTQEVCWGETFGVFIADIVNSRDLTDPLLNEPCWFRRAAAMVNVKYANEGFNLQLLLTPIPRNNLLPDKNSFFDVLPEMFAATPVQKLKKFHPGRAGKDAEYGGKIGYLFDCGFDASLFFLRHWNRNVVYALEPQGLRPLSRQVSTCGLSFSQVFELTVFRGDLLYHHHTPWDGAIFGFPVRENVLEGVLGVDRTTADGWIFGAQAHTTVWKRDELFAVSAQMIKDFYDCPWQIELFIYAGVNTSDFWIQPKVIWCGPEGWEVSLRADVIFGKQTTGTISDGLLAPFRDKDRVFLWVKRLF